MSQIISGYYVGKQKIRFLTQFTLHTTQAKQNLTSPRYLPEKNLEFSGDITGWVEWGGGGVMIEGDWVTCL